MERAMPRPSITWLITDTHFFHDEIVKHCGRPDNHLQLIMNNLRYCLAPQDLLIHLGDVIFYKYPELKAMMDSIPGTKVLTIGNHDKKSISWYMRNGFAFAATMFQIGDVIFSHKPISPLPSGVKLNIHGHWHNIKHHDIPDFYNNQQYRLLAIENTDYKPVKLSEFKENGL